MCSPPSSPSLFGPPNLPPHAPRPIPLTSPPTTDTPPPTPHPTSHTAHPTPPWGARALVRSKVRRICIADFFVFNLGTGPRRSLKLSDTKVYDPACQLENSRPASGRSSTSIIWRARNLPIWRARNLLYFNRRTLPSSVSVHLGSLLNTSRCALYWSVCAPPATSHLNPGLVIVRACTKE